jgi:plasmid stabilization system protein ParE
VRRLTVRSVASAELAQAFEWYAARSPDVAARFLAELDATMLRIEENPEAWPLARGAMRGAAVKHFPDGVYYRIFPNVISILGVVHGRRHPSRWIRRSEA